MTSALFACRRYADLVVLKGGSITCHARVHLSSRFRPGSCSGQEELTVSTTSPGPRLSHPAPDSLRVVHAVRM